MNRLFKMDRGSLGSAAPYTASACGSDLAALAGTQGCEPYVIGATGLSRFTTSAEEGDAACNSADQIVYTSLANMALYGPGTTTCGNGHTIKALSLASCSYTGFTGTAASLLTVAGTCSSTFVAPSTTTAAVGGAYPAKRALYLALPLVSKMAAKWGVGNGTGWTDKLGLTKAMDVINFMEASAANQGQAAVAGVGFITITSPAKQPIPDADINLDGTIDLGDIGQITGRWNKTTGAGCAAADCGQPSGWIRGDIDNDGSVGLGDIGQVTGKWGAAGFVAP
jgi:hypothetical protein